MGLETDTTVTLTCDICGRVIAAGETVHRLTEQAASGTFDGTDPSLEQDSYVSATLCADDYKARCGQLLAATPVLAPIVTVNTVPPVV